ncbi:hypothetical protein Tco_0539466 [Tanacetum coccineum]
MKIRARGGGVIEAVAIGNDIAKKEQNIKEKADTTLSLPSKEASPVWSLSWPVAEFFKDKGCVKKVLNVTKLPEGGNSHSAYSPYHLKGKVIFEGVRNVTPWAADGGRRKRVKCYVQCSERRKRKKDMYSRNSESELHSSMCLVGERNEMEILQNPVYVEFNIP